MRYIKVPINRFIQLYDVTFDTYTTLNNNLLRVNNNASGIEAVPVGTVLNSAASTSVLSSNNTFIRAALTGDVTANENSNVTTIANNVVTNAKAADMPALTIKGNNTTSVADPKDLSIAQARTLLRIDPIDITINELITLRNNSVLERGAFYRTTNFHNFVFEALTINSLQSSHVITKAVKSKYYKDNSNVKGILGPNTSYASSDIVIWGGRIWTKGTGTTTLTSIPSNYLDANTANITNFTMVPTNNSIYYHDVLLFLNYDIDVYTDYGDIMYGSFITTDNNQIIINGIDIPTALFGDWCQPNVYGNIVENKIINNKCEKIINNTALARGIYNNYTKHIINNSCLEGSINNNILTSTSEISNNECLAGIMTNTNYNIYNNKAAMIFNNINSGISYNTCDFYIYANTNCDIKNNIVGEIHSNSGRNNSTLYINNNTGNVISGNILSGNITYNICVSITQNTQFTNLVSTNSILITKNYCRSISGNILYNNNATNGVISNNFNNGGINDNTNRGAISGNSNNGDINNNSNASYINNNNNNGDINNNSNASYINNNNNNGSIVSNTNRGYIADNSNNGAINSNTSTNAGGSGNNIYNNINQGFINFNNFTANGFGIAFNVNNGNIGGTSIVNRSAAIVDTQIHKS